MHLKRKAWEELRGPLQARLHALQMAAIESGLPVIILVEGWDAAGKGASIQMLSAAFDPRGFKTWSIRAPRGADNLYPWLWRFWMKLPASGEIAIFDQGWYSQALECQQEEDRRRALRDVVDLETALVEDGYALVKLWLEIGQDVQRRRLKARDKRLAGDHLARGWAQNRNYAAHAQAAAEMIARTGSARRPWTIVEARDPHFTWWKVCDTVAEAIADGLRGRGVRPPLSSDDAHAVRAHVPHQLPGAIAEG